MLFGIITATVSVTIVGFEQTSYYRIGWRYVIETSSRPDVRERRKQSGSIPSGLAKPALASSWPQRRRAFDHRTCREIKLERSLPNCVSADSTVLHEEVLNNAQRLPTLVGLDAHHIRPAGTRPPSALKEHPLDGLRSWRRWSEIVRPVVSHTNKVDARIRNVQRNCPFASVSHAWPLHALCQADQHDITPTEGL
jgi:hypothetical protein